MENGIVKLANRLHLKNQLILKIIG